MLQESTQALLIKAIQSLETGSEVIWEDQIEFGKECLYEMHQMTRPSFSAYRMQSTDAKWPTHLPDSARLHRALPYVKAMVCAIRHRDRAVAISSGKSALAAMNGAASPNPLGGGPPPSLESEVVPSVVRQEIERVKKHHRIFEDRTLPRRVRAATGN